MTYTIPKNGNYQIRCGNIAFVHLKIERSGGTGVVLEVYMSISVGTTRRWDHLATVFATVPVGSDEGSGVTVRTEPDKAYEPYRLGLYGLTKLLEATTEEQKMYGQAYTRQTARCWCCDTEIAM